MKKSQNKLNIKKIIKWGCIGAVVIFLAVVVTRYFTTYHAAEESVSAYLNGNGQDGVKVSETEWGFFIDGPGKDNAVVFYPGCKVENEAYIPMFYNLAKEGYDCLMINVPLRHAVFGKNSGDAVMKQYNYKKWLFAGHSMGGMAISDFAASKADEIDGVILLGAHATKKLYDKNVKVLSMYGDKDTVVNKKAVSKDRENLGKNFVEYVINGGNHAGWAYYGVQAMDSPAEISQEKQQQLGIEKILETFGK